MDARRAVEIAQAESEATGGEPLPEETSGKRRGRPVVQSVRLPAEELAETGADRGAGRGASRGTDPGWVLAGLVAELGPRSGKRSTTWPRSRSGYGAWQRRGLSSPWHAPGLGGR
jgi:hypothetical protein